MAFIFCPIKKESLIINYVKFQNLRTLGTVAKNGIRKISATIFGTVASVCRGHYHAMMGVAEVPLSVTMVSCFGLVCGVQGQMFLVYRG